MMDRYSVRLGSLIMDTRKQQGKTQIELAKELCISKQYLSDIERGNRHPVDAYFLDLLACTLHLSKDYIYYLAGRIPPDVQQLDLNADEAEEGFDAFRQVREPKGLDFHIPPKSSREVIIEVTRMGRVEPKISFDETLD